MIAFLRADSRERQINRVFFFLIGLIGVAFLQSTPAQAGTTNYFVRGVLKEVREDANQLIIAHEEITNFMEAMTMPFNMKDAVALTNVKIGAEITFQLHVTETESWIDDIKPAGKSQSPANRFSALSNSDVGFEMVTNTSTPVARNPLRDYKFTNELGQPVGLSNFKGQAIALTFIFTHCPIPEFCPRLSRNFQEVQSRLKQMENAPTNWHLISVSIDPERDTPEALKAYGAAYQYDPAHWSFLTGPKDKIAELARLCDVKFSPEGGSINHNFRTLIINASNQLQMVFPTSGNLSESIVQELIKGASVANGTANSVTNDIRIGLPK